MSVELSEGLKKSIRKQLHCQQNTEIGEDDLQKLTAFTIDVELMESGFSIDELKQLTKLRILSFNKVAITDRTMEALGELEQNGIHIETLSISDAEMNLNADIEKLQLEHLILENVSGVDLSKFASETIKRLTIINCKDAKLEGIPNFHALETINLANNKWLKKENLSPVLTAKNVVLDGCNIDGKVESRDEQTISKEKSYTPGEKEDWDIELEEPKNREDLVHIPSISAISCEQLEKWKSDGINWICIEQGWKETQKIMHTIDEVIAVKGKMASIIDGAEQDLKGKPYKDNYARYLAARKRLIESFRYDYAALDAKKGEDYYYASRDFVYAMRTGQGVCAAIAASLCELAHTMGYEAHYIEGRTDTGELHAWLQIGIKQPNQQIIWYNDDPTWDVINNSAGERNDQWCLMTDEEFNTKHKKVEEKRSEKRHVCNIQRTAPINCCMNDLQSQGKKVEIDLTYTE